MAPPTGRALVVRSRFFYYTILVLVTTALINQV